MIYDKCVMYINKNPELDICRKLEDDSYLLLKYVSFCYLNNIDLDFESDKKDDYFNMHFRKYNKDIMNNILDSDYSSQDKKSFIALYYTDNSILEDIGKQRIRIPEDFDLVEDFLIETFDAKEFSKENKLVDMDDDLPVYLYVSAVIDDNISINIFEGYGCFCCVSYTYGLASLDGKDYYIKDDVDIMQISKMIGNETRYNILKLLNDKGPMTMTQISKELDLTLPTIDHHISGLFGSLLINVDSLSLNTRNKKYRIEEKTFQKYMRGLKKFIE